MFCPECGAKQEPSSKFCLKCGAKLPLGEAPRQPDPLPENAPRAPSWQIHVPQRNYLVRHWRGELSLPVSYWVNGMLLGMAVGVLARVLAPSDEFVVRHFSAYGVGAIVYLVALILLSTWQLVGIWNSASNYAAEGKSRGWAGLAKVAVVLGGIQLANVLFTTGVPVMRDNFHILAGDSADGRYQLRVLRDATELEISGPIRFGLTEDVRQILDAQPTIRIVHLNSGGGRVAEARALRDLIAERGLITYTATGCASACTIAYMAGKERWIDPKATLGFHEYSLVGVSEPQTDGGYAQEKANWTREGVPQAFINKAFATPASTIWKPSLAQLVQAHVVTKYAGMADTAVSGLNVSDVEHALDAIPVYAALRDVEPATYEQIHQIVRDGVARGHSMAEIRTLTVPLLQAALHRHLADASDGALQTFTRVMLDEMRELYSKDPSLCFDYVFSLDAGANRAVQAFSPEIQKREFDAMGLVLESAARAPGRPISESEAQAEFQPVIENLVKTYGNDVALIAEPRKVTNKARGCEIVYAMYAGAMKLPGKQSADVLRYLFSSR